jgi:transcriptional regulator with XRE-family HTH domain
MSSHAKTVDICDQLREAVRTCGLSLNKLAEASGVDKAQLSRFLREKRTMNLKAAARVCACLGRRLAGPTRHTLE